MTGLGPGGPVRPGRRPRHQLHRPRRRARADRPGRASRRSRRSTWSATSAAAACSSPSASCARCSRRSAPGKGQVVDAAMVDGAAVLMTMFHAFRAMGIWEDERGTNLLDTGAWFYDVYETDDGKYISIGSIERQFYAELLIELSGLKDEPDWPCRTTRPQWPAHEGADGRDLQGRRPATSGATSWSTPTSASPRCCRWPRRPSTRTTSSGAPSSSATASCSPRRRPATQPHPGRDPAAAVVPRPAHRRGPRRVGRRRRPHRRAPGQRRHRLTPVRSAGPPRRPDRATRSRRRAGSARGPDRAARTRCDEAPIDSRRGHPGLVPRPSRRRDASRTGGTLARAAADGHRVVLVFGTRGEQGEPVPGVLAEGEQLWERRVVETHRSAEITRRPAGRVPRLRGLRDDGRARPTTTRRASGRPTSTRPPSGWPRSSRDEDADVLTVYDDHGGYGHPDHIQVHRVGVRAAELAGDRPGLRGDDEPHDVPGDAPQHAREAIEAAGMVEEFDETPGGHRRPRREHLRRARGEHHPRHRRHRLRRREAHSRWRPTPARSPTTPSS